MVGFLVLLGLFLLGSAILPWVNLVRLNRLESEIEALRRNLKPSTQSVPLPEAATEPETPATGTGHKSWAERLREAEADEDAAKRTRAALAMATVTEKAETPRRSASVPAAKETVKPASLGLEMSLATKLPVWLGAISLVCAVFFLVKYSIEAGWLGPVARLGIGMAFGLGLIAAAERVARTMDTDRYGRIAQGLAGAGVVALYVCLSAGVHLYHVLPPVIGFAGMAAVTAAAVVLSYRHGQPIAIFGILGGFLTPVLVGSNEPNTLMLFAYLFVLSASMTSVMVRRGWWKLAAVSLGGVYVWAGLWQAHMFVAQDAYAVVLFAVAISVATLATTARHLGDNGTTQVAANTLNIIGIAGSALTIMTLGSRMQLGLFDWAMLELLSVAALVLAYLKPVQYRTLAWGKLAADLLVFAIWSKTAQDADTLAVLLALTAIFVVLPGVALRRAEAPAIWAQMQVVSALALYVLAFWRLDMPAHSFDGMWGLVGLVLAGFSVWQVRDVYVSYDADAKQRDALAGLYALGATAFVSIALAIELPYAYLPMAFAMQIAATAWLGKRLDAAYFNRIAVVLVLVFATLNLPNLLAFADIALQSLGGEAGSLARYLVAFKQPVAGFVIPSVFVFAAYLLERERTQASPFMIKSTAITAAALATAGGYVLIRSVVAPTHDFLAIAATFAERGVVTLYLAALGYGAIRLAGVYGDVALRRAGIALMHLVALRLAYFDLFTLMPLYAEGQSVGTLPILNGVTMTYGGGLLATGFMLRHGLGADAPMRRKAYGILAFALLLALVSLNIRQMFHGTDIAGAFDELTLEAFSNAEYYIYSVAWLLTGLGLLAYGVIFESKPARAMSLAFMLLTVAKVFLFDAAELEGLLRIFSFLGLGVSLIGISFLYTRFVFRPKGDTGA